MHLKKSLRTILATGMLMAGGLTAAQAQETQAPEKTSTVAQAVPDYSKTEIEQLVLSYESGRPTAGILDIRLLDAYGLKSTHYVFETGQQANSTEGIIQVEKQRVPQETLSKMRLMRDYRNGVDVSNLTITKRSVYGVSYYEVVFPDGSKGRMDEKGNVTYPAPKAVAKAKEQQSR